MEAVRVREQIQLLDLSSFPLAILRVRGTMKTVQLPAADEVHAWSVDLGASAVGVEKYLASADQRRAATLRRGRHRERWMTARASLRGLLGQYLDTDPTKLTFRTPGKPELVPRSPLRFNLAHSGDAALVALAVEREVGVDLEEVIRGRNVGGLCELAFVTSESAAVLAADDPDEAFARYWVAKEALVKAIGVGLKGLRSCELSLASPAKPEIRRVLGDETHDADWSLHLLCVEKPFVAAVAVEGRAVHVADLQPFTLNR